MRSCEWCFPESTTNFEHVPLQYKGFCGFALVKKSGLLLPGTNTDSRWSDRRTYRREFTEVPVHDFWFSGNPNIGVLKHKEKYYAFSSKSAAYEFAAKADEFTAAVVELAKRTPELIQLLQLHQEFASVTPYSEVPASHRPSALLQACSDWSWTAGKIWHMQTLKSS